MTMQAYIHQISSDLGNDRPLAWIVCNHQGHLVAAQQLVEVTVAETLVSYLDGMAQRLLRVSGLDQGMIISHALIMIGGNLGSRPRGARQLSEERLHPTSIKAEIRWQLP